MDFAKKRTDGAKGLSEGATEDCYTPRPVAPIRLGGRRVLSLNVLPGEIIAPLDHGEPIDVSGLLDHFSEDERRFLQARFEGAKLREMPAQLGWSQRKVDAVRIRVARHARGLRGTVGSFRRANSLLLIRREFVAGRPTWELDRLGREFREVMDAERAKTFFHQNVQNRRV